MLDPLTALSLASSVVQFIDFGVKLTSDGVELYGKGGLSNHDELEQAANDLVNLTGRLIPPPQATSGFQFEFRDDHLSKEELALQQLAKASRELGLELVSIIEGLRVSKPQNGLESFRKAIRSSRKKGRIQDLETRLKRLQDQLGTHLLFLLSDRNSLVLSKLNDLSECVVENEINTSLKINQLREDVLAALRRQEKQKEKKSQKNKESLKRQPAPQEVFDNIGERCQKLIEESRQIENSLLILNSLFFSAIKARQTTVKEAHPRTFEWIFDESADNKLKNPGFKSWLENGNGIFWVAGKAGSGKSTLMKYLYDNIKTRDTLQKWAGENELVVASYYFWSAGNTMQKSQEGLLQSLLYQILRQCPQLIPKVCSSRWKSASKSKIQDPWTLQELSGAFMNLTEEADLSTRFFFFVDGLDEYDGEHADIINVLRGLASCPSFKLCVSSRPWNVFVEAFGNSDGQKMLLQDFTRGDITLYVKNKLKEDPRFLVLMRRDNRYKKLVEDIVEKAGGVFLWVYLVVRSLLRGLTDDNDIATLQLRLDHLPADLEEYFKQIFSNIEDVYQQQTAQIFQIAVHATSALPAIAFYFLEKEKEDPDYALNWKREKPFSDEDAVSISKRISKHLNARCKDLVEIHSQGQAWKRNVYFYQVGFLHRSVRDFLLTKDMHALLRSRSPAGFDANVSLCRISLALAKTSYFGDLKRFWQQAGSRFSLFWDFFFYAKEIENSMGYSEVLILDDMYRLISNMGYTFESFMERVIGRGLHLYVAHKLDRMQQEPWRNSLLHSVSGLKGERRGNTMIDVEMVRLLLEQGANPNYSRNGDASIWKLFLHTCSSYRGDTKNRKPPVQLFQTAQLFIQHGASLYLESTDARRETPLEILKSILRPTQYEQILALATEMRASRSRNPLSRLWKLSRFK